MRSRDLEAELFSGADRVRQPHLDRLGALGVTPAAVAALNRDWPAFGVVEAEVGTDGLFTPGGGLVHIVMPVVDGGALIDLVAWRSDNPLRWWLRTGLGWLLNADPCLASRWDAQHLTLHSSPLDWLRACDQGAWEAGGVVLDFDAPDLAALRNYDTIVCSDERVTALLKRTLAKPSRLPAILTKEVRDAA
jgi:hypothetical protein